MLWSKEGFLKTYNRWDPNIVDISGALLTLSFNFLIQYESYLILNSKRAPEMSTIFGAREYHQKKVVHLKRTFFESVESKSVNLSNEAWLC